MHGRKIQQVNYFKGLLQLNKQCVIHPKQMLINCFLPYFLCVSLPQTRTALIHILNDLAEDDYLGLVSFDSEISHWRRELVQATRANLEGAKRFAYGITDRGSEIFQYTGIQTSCSRMAIN